MLVTLGQAEIHIVGPSKVFQLSERLPVSKAYLSTLLEPSFVADEDGKIIWVNEMLCRYFRVEIEECCGRTFKELHIPLLTSIVTTMEYQNALSGNMTKSWVYLEKDQVRYRLWIAPVVFIDGTPAVLALIEQEGLF